jgi:hypothetical protein
MKDWMRKEGYRGKFTYNELIILLIQSSTAVPHHLRNRYIPKQTIELAKAELNETNRTDVFQR